MNQARVMIAIAGGSGAGKTWLSRRIAEAFPTEATWVSLDDFYFDQSHLSPEERRRINYDDPQAIDWELLKIFLREFYLGHATKVPRYDFSTHCRTKAPVECRPTRLLVADGLWLLTRPDVRELFDLSVFIECPAQVRLERRLARDLVERGRDAEEVHHVFATVVAPMHIRHVTPQRRFATVVLHDPVSEADLEGVIGRIYELLRCGTASQKTIVRAPRLERIAWRSAA
jgi:uridine kinase